MNSRGFSLIELTVVTAITTTLLFIALSSGFNPTSQVKEKAQSEAVKQALVQARNTARFELQCVSVQVNAQSLDITQYTSCPPAPANLVSTKTISFSPLISLVAFDTGNPIVFNPQGGTDANGPSTLNVNGLSGKAFFHTIYPAIGAMSSR